LFIRFDRIHERERQTPHDGTGGACKVSHGKNKYLTKIVQYTWK